MLELFVDRAYRNKGMRVVFGLMQVRFYSECFKNMLFIQRGFFPGKTYRLSLLEEEQIVGILHGKIQVVQYSYDREVGAGQCFYQGQQLMLVMDIKRAY